MFEDKHNYIIEKSLNSYFVSQFLWFQILKRCHHPNIISLYGYNFSVTQKQQYLVFEYASRGSLELCLADRTNKALLSVQTRFSIMYQVARSIHFLHSGGADGHIVLHRDIKSANIVLTHDYTAKLIDCGLATFVQSDPNAISKSASNCISSSNGICGTAGYICPEYARTMGQYPYSEACDMFSLGVVLVEIICGQVQNQNLDFFEKYVMDDGSLVDDVDPSLEWQSPIVDQLCKLALRCMSLRPKMRPLSQDVAEQLGTLQTLCFCSSNNLSTDNFQGKECASDSSPPCILCNRASTAGVHCNQEQHWTCMSCFNKDIIRKIGRDGTGVRCTVQGCTSSVFDDDYLYGKIDKEIYDLYVTERIQQQKLDKIIAGMGSLRQSSSVIQHNLAYLATEDVKKCPTLIWLVPCNPKNKNDWIMTRIKKLYKLYFICERSFQVVDPPIKIRFSREWMVKIAPILRMGLFLLKTAANSNCLPFPFPLDISACTTMEDMVESLLDDNLKDLLHEANSSSSFDWEGENKVFTLMRTAHEMISEVANQPRNTDWKKKMAPVLEQHKLIWVKREFLFCQPVSQPNLYS
jgi:hypothetical protein